MKKILVIFLVILSLYLLFTNLDRIPWLPFGKSEDSVKITDKIDKINIDISTVSTKVIPEKISEVRAQLKGKGEVNVSRNGDTIEVEYKRGFFDWFPFTKTSNLTIFVPEDYDKDMELRIGSGHLEFISSSMKLNNLSAEVQSGNLKLHHLTVREFNHNVASGNSTIKSLSTQEGEFEIHSGNVNLEGYSGKLDVDISSGRLKAQIAELTDAISIEVNSGLLDLDLPNDADFTLNGKENSGFISSDFTLTNSTSESNKLQGVHGSGTHEINVEVNSGKVDIY
ncbi:DUF4097 family beta strand repeat-containing protein [Fredinandcohnia humi]